MPVKLQWSCNTHTACNTVIVSLTYTYMYCRCRNKNKIPPKDKLTVRKENDWIAGKKAHLPSLVMGVSSSWYICRTISAVSSLLWLFMSHNTSIARLRANSLAKSRPRPLPAPVITHTCPATLFSLGRTTHFAPAVTKAQSTFRMTTKNSAMMIIILTSLISSQKK